MILTPAGSSAAALHAASSGGRSHTRLSSGASTRHSICCSSHGPASYSCASGLPSKRLSCVGATAAAGTFHGSRSAVLRNRITATAAAPRSPPGSSTSTSLGADPPQKTAADAAGGHKPQQPAAVIGIDFGTSGSGYMAVVLPAPGRAKQTTMCTAWPDCPEASGDSKTRTALLYRGSKVDSFGWTAWKRWAGMTEAERRKEDWCYVEGFKLLLEGEDSGSSSSSGDGGSSPAPPDELVAKGVSSPLPRGKGATEVVSDFLAELRKYTTKRLQGPRPAAGATATATAAPAPPALDMKSVVWCVTVPALWAEAAKQRLRRAASMAGFVATNNPDSLILALEPEAAAVAVVAMGSSNGGSTSSISGGSSSSSDGTGGLVLTQVTSDPGTTDAAGPSKASAAAAGQQQQQQQRQHTRLEDGDVVLVVDCGGGTADITMHEVVIDEGAVGAGGGKAPPAVHLYEAAQGRGIKAGGRFVDAALFALLRGHLGPEVWDEWKKLHPGEWTDFAMRWETTKRVIKGGHMDLQLPPCLVAMRRQQPPPPQPPVSGSAAGPDQARPPQERPLRQVEEEQQEEEEEEGGASVAPATGRRQGLEGWMRKRLRWGRGHTSPQTINERRAAADANSKSTSGSRKSTSGGSGSSSNQQQQQPPPQDGVIVDPITGVVQLSERVLEAEVFGPVMEQIVVAAAEVEAHGRELDKRLTKVLLAGGFGNSRLLQRRLLRLAGEWGVPLVLPRDPGAAVVTGAALLGLEPSFVMARRSRLTYGVRCRAPWTVAFAESAAAFGYPQRVWRDEDGTIDADDVFETFVHAGQLVGTNEVVKRVFCPNSSTSTATQCDLYCTPAALATCVAEPGMRRLATVTLPLPEGWLKAVGRRTDYAVQVEMHFGTSEIKMAVSDPHTREAVLAPHVDWR